MSKEDVRIELSHSYR